MFAGAFTGATLILPIGAEAALVGIVVVMALILAGAVMAGGSTADWSRAGHS